MRATILTALCAAGIATAAAEPANAWDYPGHRIVGAIADAVLQRDYPKAHARVVEVLAVKDANGNVMQRTLREVAVFPDCAKPNNIPYCGRAPSPEEIAYAGRNKHHDKFHYTNHAIEQAKYQLGTAGTTNIDVVQMINYAVAQLRGNTPSKPPKTEVNLTDAEAVWLLAHLVGDIHQPLHSGAKFFTRNCKSGVDPNQKGKPPKFGIDDKVAQTIGGNRIRLASTPSAQAPAENLHLYWDGAAVTQAMKGQSEEQFAQALASSAPSGWQTTGDAATWATQWVDEAHLITGAAHQLTFKVHKSADPKKGAKGCVWETTLDKTYQETASGHAGTQLAKAGYRLAAVLNAIYQP